MAEIERYGKLYTSGDVKARFLNRTVDGIDSIKYGRKQVKQNVYGMGTREPIGRIRKERTYEASMTVKAFELDGIKKSAPNGDITKIKPFPITVMYLDDVLAAIKTEVLEYVEFTGDTIEVKNDNGEISVELELVIGGIKSVIA